MKDAFGKEMELGSNVLYSTGGGDGTVYYVGEIVKLHPAEEFRSLDKIEIKVKKANTAISGFGKNKIVYAANAVLYAE
jgi:hypothetical protein